VSWGEIVPPEGGFSLAELERLAAEAGMDLVPVHAVAGGEAPPSPCIVRGRQGHYLAVAGSRPGALWVIDPRRGEGQWQSAAALLARGSGHALVLRGQVPEGWRVLSAEEAEGLRGGLEEDPERTILDDDRDQDCPTDEEAAWFAEDSSSPASADPEACPPPERCPPGLGDGDCGERGGMPVWRVSEPAINLWVKDVPLYYPMSNGRVFPLVLRYRQRNGVENTNIFGVGRSWECSWLAYIEGGADGLLRYRVPGGGRRQWKTEDVGSMREHVKLGADGVGYTLDFRTRCFMRLEEVHAPQGSSTTNYLLSAQVDPYGRIVRFVYETTNGIKRLSAVVDFDGRTNHLGYSASQPRLVSSITDPYGRSAYLEYTNGNLCQITDVQGLTNRFEYDASGLLTAMITPYGTTRFYALTNDQDTNTPIARGLLVQLPDGSRNLFAYRERTASMPTNYALPQTMGGESFGFPETEFLHHRNSFFWDARQMEVVTNHWTNLVLQASAGAADFLNARLRHWQWRYDEGYTLTRKLLVERAPSPDGTSLGHVVWHGYPADGGLWPRVRAERLEDGPSRYIQWQRNEWGLPTSLTSSYGEGTNLAERIVNLSYDSNTERQLIDITHPDRDGLGPVARQYEYNARGQLTNVTVYVDSRGEWTEETRYTYAAETNAAGGVNLNLTSVAFPSGVLMTNALEAGSFQVTNRAWYAGSIGGSPLASSRFTWQDGKVHQSTDPRGLTLTHGWDALGRLTGLVYPDGSTVSNRYDKLDGQPFTNSSGGLLLLDRTGSKDRMGRWTWFVYDSMRRVETITNALGGETSLAWCSCGGPESVTDPLGNTTSFEYDRAGRRTLVRYPGESRVLHVEWSRSGEPTNLWDSLGWAGIGYNHQGLPARVHSAFGDLFQAQYDIHDRTTNFISASGRRMAVNYDSLGRVLEREAVTTNAASVESFGYTANIAGPVAYTNQVGTGIVLLAYDAMGRLTNRVVLGLVTNRFAYNAAGDLTNLVDGLEHGTRWEYDAEGRALRKLLPDNTLAWTNGHTANGWVSAHWTPAKGLTQYGYDGLGQLTNVNYPSSPDLDFEYDAAGRLTHWVDGLGTHRLRWTAWGALASEDGPWAQDTLSYGYNGSALRESSSLAQPNASPWAQSHGYDSLWRLTNLVSAAGSFGYSYRGASRQVAGLGLPTGGVVTNAYDDLGRLLSTRLEDATGAVLNAHGYQYDAADQRTHQTLTAGNRWEYDYDGLGQLRAAVGRETNGTTRVHEQLAYGYDPAGNLTNRANNALVQNFTITNSLNELSGVGRSGTLTVAGRVDYSGSVTVTVRANSEGSGTAATVYGDKAFARAGVTLVDGTNTFTAMASEGSGRGDTNTVAAWLPETVSFTYDANGNLTGDGRRSFEYDDENQLTAVEVAGVWRSEFQYDGFGRRRVRLEKAWRNGGWVTSAEVRYVYDGMLAVQERDGANLPKVTYTRGLDLSGSRQGAGGIGGLLARTENTLLLVPGLTGAHAYYHADGGGNITALIDGGNRVRARYGHDPFGNLLGISGPLAEANVYRFSSKEAHAASGLCYYGFRFYDPSLQRWINRDPIGEAGGLNLFGFVGNSPLGAVDSFGLADGVRWADLRDEDEECSALYHQDSFRGRFDDLTGAIKSAAYAAGESTLPGAAWVACTGTGLNDQKRSAVDRGLAAGGILAGPACKAAPKAGKGLLCWLKSVLGLGDEVVDAATSADDLAKLGRSGKQARLRELAADPNVPSADRGWIRQEINSIERGQRTKIRVPSGKHLAHRRGFEAKEGYGYEHSDLQDIELHRLQHKHEGY